MSNTLVNEKDLVMVTFGKTASENLIISWFTPQYAKYYGVKQEEDKLIFQRVKKGAFRAFGSFKDEIFEIPFSDIESFKKKPYIIGFMFNIRFPRFALKATSGKKFMMNVITKQGMLSKEKIFSDDARKSLINKLISLS